MLNFRGLKFTKVESDKTLSDGTVIDYYCADDERLVTDYGCVYITVASYCKFFKFPPKWLNCFQQFVKDYYKTKDLEPFLSVEETNQYITIKYQPNRKQEAVEMLIDLMLWSEQQFIKHNLKK